MTTDTHVVTLIGGEADGRRIQAQGWPETLTVVVAPPALSYHDEVRPEHSVPYARIAAPMLFDDEGVIDFMPLYVGDGVTLEEALRKLLQGYRA